MISDFFAKESIISYFRSDIIAGPEGFVKNLQNLDSMQVGSGFGGMGDKFDSIFPPSNIDNIIVVSGFMLVVRYADEN